MTSAFSAIFKVIADFLVALASNWMRDRDLEAKGRAEGAAELNKIVAEGADEQAQNNALDRGGAADVLNRLRNRHAGEQRG